MSVYLTKIKVCVFEAFRNINVIPVVGFVPFGTRLKNHPFLLVGKYDHESDYLLPLAIFFHGNRNQPFFSEREWYIYLH